MKVLGGLAVALVVAYVGQKEAEADVARAAEAKAQKVFARIEAQELSKVAAGNKRTFRFDKDDIKLSEKGKLDYAVAVRNEAVNALTHHTQPNNR